MFAPLSLRDAKPLTAGSRRYVFQHPHEPNALVKVLKREWGLLIPLGVPGLHIRRPNEMVRSFRREIGEFLRVRQRIPNGPVPIARVYGIVETDRGTGLVVERVSGRDGKLALSLAQHVQRHGLSDELERLILRLRDDLIRHDIVAGDVNPKNVVVGVDAAGTDRLVIVDGIGDKTFLPVNSISSLVNRLSHQRRFARMLTRLREMDSTRRKGLEEAGRPAAGGSLP